ncbi:MAG: Sec-independent protein translocase protein TatB [Gammaproteobacteria bacterium]|nr:Sec-independent protein translocase protein TatB [Gammaproteobacteria bacterium]NND38602.1 twin-arginine translocase subunit TatB [Pseudomonadales bacterium]NNL11562.1 twin-arginine translocase subunit TatB [Pseudomonadales bacterium]NNM11750.1 twin-arginine translocase subunit TatB [Pseudomonadales bacterium]
MNIGMQELLVISVLALVVLGPERLPTAIKTLAVWSSRMRRSFNDLKTAVEREIDADEIRQQIHNENVLHELGETREALESFGRQANEAVSGDVGSKPDKTGGASSEAAAKP